MIEINSDENRIIQLLLSSSEYLSSYEIAKIVGISRRMVREQISDLKKILPMYDCRIISKASKGYKLEGAKSSLKKLNLSIDKLYEQKNFLFPNLPWQRQHYIIKRLIENNNYVKIDDLSDELFVSRSTISSDLKLEINNLKKYHLTIQQKPKYGVKIVGEEQNKRKALCDFIFKNFTKSKMIYDYLDTFLSYPLSLEYSVIHIIEESKITFTDIALCDFLICLTVSLSRIESGQSLTTSQDIEHIRDRKEFNVAYKIADKIKMEKNIVLNKHEINYVAIELICKKTIDTFDAVYEKLSKEIYNSILDKIYTETLLDFRYKKFEETLMKNIDYTLMRIYYNEKIRTPFYDDIQVKAPLSYELACICSSVFAFYTQSYLSLSELALYAAIFQNELHSLSSNKVKTLLVCSLGLEIGKLTESLIKKYFYNQISIVKIGQYYKLLEEDLSQYDLILSTVPIHTELSVPTINISYDLEENDIVKMTKYLHRNANGVCVQSVFMPQFCFFSEKLINEVTLKEKIYELLHNSFQNLKKSFINELSHCSVKKFQNKVGILTLPYHISNPNIAVVIVSRKGIIYNQTKYNMVIFVTEKYNNSDYIENVKQYILTVLSHKNKLDYILEKLSYVALIENFLHTENISDKNM